MKNDFSIFEYFFFQEDQGSSSCFLKSARILIGLSNPPRKFIPYPALFFSFQVLCQSQDISLPQENSNGSHSQSCGNHTNTVSYLYTPISYPSVIVPYASSYHHLLLLTLSQNTVSHGRKSCDRFPYPILLILPPF